MWRGAMCFMVEKQNRGPELEGKIYNILESLNLGHIKHEKDLIAHYGYNASSVDFLIELAEGIIIIQTKWKGSKRREDKDIRNFLRSFDYLRQIYENRYNKPVLFGLWVSRLEPFDDNRQRLGNINVHAISCFESIDVLGIKTANFIRNKI